MSPDTTLDETPRDPEPRTRPAVRVLCEAGRIEHGPVRWLDSGVCRIGRAEDAALRLDDPRVSRRHAELRVQGGATWLEDLSKGGTFVGESRVEEPRRLEDGDVVVVGASALVYRREVAGQRAARPLEGFVGDAPAVRALRATVSRLGPTGVTVLVRGETGSGKEVVARALHEASGRTGPFVAVNCGAIPTNLVESQLFGHVGGAFTGAKRDAPGLFASADGGTLFLDEVGELAMDAQPKLLRVIETRTVTPVGGTEPREVDIRLVAATHRNLLEGVAEGSFRADLYARISDFVLTIPPLRQRIEDVFQLLEVGFGGPPPRLSARLVRALVAHPWPFNVREVLKVGAQLRVAAADGRERLDVELVQERLAEARRVHEALVADREDGDGPEPAVPDREALVALLREHGGIIADIARATGRSRRQVYRWLAKHELDVEDYRAG